MKKVLVTGAAGSIGLCLIKYLLSEGKYEITALDLKTKNVYKSLRRYRHRINIVYGDVLDRNLLEPLIKEANIVIHLSTCLPPLAEYKKALVDLIDYSSTENIVRAINYYNPKCLLIYASSTSLYSKDITDVNEKLRVNETRYFDSAKLASEKIISKKVKNYIILRVPLVLSDLRNEPFIYNIKGSEQIEVITKEDAGYAFCASIDKFSRLNNKIINIGGGQTCRCLYNELLANILKYHGISWKYVLTLIFGEKNYTSSILKDSDDSNKLLGYRNDSLQSYFMRQKRRSKNRKVAILLAKPFVYFINKKIKKETRDEQEDN